MKPTIYDVADRAKVSIATVSRVLNGRAKVTEETKARVMEAVEALSYRPSPVARGLALRSTEVLALFYESFSGYYPSQIISGAEAQAAASGYALLAYQIQGRDWDDMIRMPARADGVIVSGSFTNEAFLQALARDGIPTVILGAPRADLKMDGVRPDNVGGTVAAIEHLIAHGYKRIAHIRGAATSRHADERVVAYQETLARHGLEARPEWLVDGEYTIVGGVRPMKQLLALSDRPDAVFCSDDLIALGAMSAIEHAGLRIPDDVAVIGFDNIEAAEYTTPTLSTVFQPVEDTGRVAVRLLLERIADKDMPAREELLPTELIVRGSCGLAGTHVETE